MNSDRRLSEFTIFFAGLGPIRMIYNTKVIYDDENMSGTKLMDGYKAWQSILERNPIIYNISINIAHYHHAKISLIGEEI